MITLSNGHSFEYMTPSGTFGFDGRGWPWERLLKPFGLFDPSLFTNVAKTLTLKPQRGNLRWYKPWSCVMFIWGGPRIVGTVNAVKLTNRGIDWWIETVGSRIRPEENLMASILGEPKELAIMATILNNYNLCGIEVNISCPNTQDDLLENTQKAIDGCIAVKRKSRHPVLVKLSVVHDVKTIVPALAGIAEAFSINSVPWDIVFPGKKSPLWRLGGGAVSGKAAQQHTWACARQLKSLTAIPVIPPSIWDYDDIGKLRSEGFEVFSFGALALPFPWCPTDFVRRDMNR